MKKLLSVLIVVGVLFGCIGASAATMYSTDGRTIDVPNEQVELWESVGWYRESNTIIVYAEDGRTQRIPVVAFDAWHRVGWYSAPVMRVYSTDGRSVVICKADYNAWKKVGWMDTPMEQLYAPYLRAVCKTAWAEDSYAYPGYVYYDINKDGVKELIVDDGLCEADTKYYVYTIVNGEVEFVGSMYGGHTGLAHIPNKNGVLVMWGHQGYFGAERVELVNGKLVSKTVLKNSYYKGDYPNAWDVVKGSFDLAMTWVR